MIRGIGQIAIKVGSLAEGQKFYGEILRLTPLFVAPNVAGYDLAGVRLLLIEHPGFTSSRSDGVAIYLSADRIEEMHKVLLSAGAKDAGAPHCVAVMGGNETWVSFVEDPFGNTIGLIEDRGAQ